MMLASLHRSSSCMKLLFCSGINLSLSASQLPYGTRRLNFRDFRKTTLRPKLCADLPKVHKVADESLNTFLDSREIFRRWWNLEITKNLPELRRVPYNFQELLLWICRF